MSETAGGSAASSAAASSVAGAGAGTDAPSEDVVEVSAGVDSAAVRLKQPAPIYTKSGDDFVVPQVTIDSIESFKAKDEYQREGAREDSFLYSLGNYAAPVEKSGKWIGYYKCQVGKCRTSTKTTPCPKGSKSNVNKHFREVHQLVGAKGAVRMENAQNHQGNIRAAMGASKTFGVGGKRVKELQAAKLVVEKMLPFSFFSSGGTFKEMMATATGTSSYPTLPPRRVKHLITELYVATKKVVVGNMVQEVERAPLPILHHNIDIWTDKGSGRKFLGLHVFYVDANFELKDALLSIKRYAPDQGSLGDQRASDVLFQIMKSVLEEFGLKPSHLASGTTDSGSDVKAVSTNCLWPMYAVLWCWCFCHLMVKAAEQAYGIHLDPAKSKNPQARDILKKVVKVVENLNKSPNFKAKFEDLQVDMLGEIFKMVKHAPQRWLSLTRTVERTIRLWHVLRKLYSDEGRNFPLEEGDTKDAILQLYSLLQPLSSITRDGQYGDAPMMADIFMKFGMLNTDVLDPSKDLKVFQVPPIGEDGLPDRGQQKKPLPFKMVPPEQLHAAVEKTRVEMRRALVSRFYGRVWDENTLDPPFFCHAACLLTPPFSEGLHVAAMKLAAGDDEYLPSTSTATAPTMDEEVTAKLDETWKEIKERAVEAVKKEQAAASSGPGAAGVFKRARTAGGGGRRRPVDGDEFAAFGRSVGGVEESKQGDAVEQEVANEIMRYKGVFMTSNDLHPTEVLSYWATTGRHSFPALKHVAQQTFGSQPSAAPVERDFSGCGLFLVPNRSRVEEYWVEMVMFLNANFKFIPKYDNIPSIDSKDIRKCLPAKFKGTDEDLLSAEMALDPLRNNTPPGEDDTGL
ncbi:unnamed protein product [Ectocarpus sp. CCAP 1310/34]|nr:unnamed protein product [Ectocarpus sp. CCAP 1310/34]